MRFAVQTIGVVSVLCAAAVRAEERPAFQVQKKPDRLIISRSERPVADFVFHDEQIKRPYFANLHTPGGLPVTRRHPPNPQTDATDHDLMHPGLWLAFGDINGHDFWRNLGSIKLIRFSHPPAIKNHELQFSTESRLMTPDDEFLCTLNQDFVLIAGELGDLLLWRATFQPDNREMVFGDQEEMGFGVRLATPLIEKNGGRIINSHGQATAGKTWGQSAAWCDYSGMINERPAGITCFAAPSNFRGSWWHNRDYGLMVANPFGRAAMKQGPASAITVKPGASLRLDFGVCLHDAAAYRPEAAYAEYLQTLTRWDAR